MRTNPGANSRSVGDPFHRGPLAALRGLAPSGSTEKIKIDLAHTWSIAGCGKDYLASGLVFIAVHCRHFGAGAWELLLDRAFEDFSRWCVSNKKVSSIKEFSKEELKITSFLTTLRGSRFELMHLSSMDQTLEPFRS